MEKIGTAQTTRHSEESAVTLNATQISLAVGVVSVCCLMAFGGGVIAGMWYKASEQTTPYTSAVAALVTEAGATGQTLAEEPPAAPRVTFYETLKGKTPYTPLGAGAGSPGVAKAPLTSALPAGAMAAKTPVASPVIGGPADTPKTSLLPPVAAPARTAVMGSSSGSLVEAPKAPLPTVPAGNTSDSAQHAVTLLQSPPASSEPNKGTVGAAAPQNQVKTTASASSDRSLLKPTVAVPAPKASVASVKPAVAPEPKASSGLKPVVASASTGATTAPPRESAAVASRAAAIAVTAKGSSSDAESRRRVEVQSTTAAPAPRTSSGQYSVQAGSFRSPEQAERLRSQLAQKGYQVRVQLFTSPTNESWYRVRVGSFNDRAAAGQTAQHLSAQEQVQTVVATEQH